MAKFRRPIRRGRRFTKNRGWLSTVVEGTQPASTFGATGLVFPVDYNRGNVESWCTLETIYLELAVASASAQAAAVNWAIFGIVVADFDVGLTAPSMDPDNADNLADERWLWTTRFAVSAATATSGPLMRFPVHVKQRVRLKDSMVRFVASNSDPVEAYDYSFHARCLIRFP